MTGLPFMPEALAPSLWSRSDLENAPFCCLECLTAFFEVVCGFVDVRGSYASDYFLSRLPSSKVRYGMIAPPAAASSSLAEVRQRLSLSWPGVLPALSS